ncbi:MAG: AAA family ATPase [Thiohalorhabdus sp.]|uniref:bifunctional aminoglycoside phosphotransferase/ATP-binding protein n=1 Tax=Thiohalorhabdus sp. TaxID=3094134 RepID=UPI002FC391A0
MEDHWPPLIRALTDPGRYPHSVDEVRVVETHISYVLLTGDFAYKIKKPFDLGFLDFSTLAKRYQACAEELRLNRRTAPDLYLNVWSITGTPEAPVLNGSGQAFEYVVRMVQFDPACRADRCLERDELTLGLLGGLGEGIAELHEGAAEPPEDTGYGAYERVRADQDANLTELRAALDWLPVSLERFQTLANWIDDFLSNYRDLFMARRRAGRIREGHGDLHMANLVLRHGQLVPFDAIEFDPDLRFTDVMADVAFAWMDLLSRGRRDLATHFLNAYLQRTGDYAGVRLLPFYTIYRALVRAKVAALQAGDAQAGEADDLRQRGEHYFRLAEALAHEDDARLIIGHGVTGVGKSLVSEPVVAELGGVRIRSDVERKRLAGRETEVSGTAEVGSGIYNPEMSARTYNRLLELARPVLAAGLPVFLDATYLKAARRRAARGLAAELAVPFGILALEAPEAEIRRWIRERAAEADNPSDADEEVLDSQLRSQEPLTEDEEAITVRVDTSRQLDFARIGRELLHTARVPRV